MTEPATTILRWRRAAPPAQPVEPDPGRWGAWAGRQYAAAMRLHRSPPVELRRSRTWAAHALGRRKLCALALFALALERYQRTQASGWAAQCERWQAVYAGIDAADPPDERADAATELYRSRESAAFCV